MIILILTIFFYFPTEAIGKCNVMKYSNLSVCIDCNSNPCNLGGYFSVQNGYRCAQVNVDIVCICPNGGYEINQPCRMSRMLD